MNKRDADRIGRSAAINYRALDRAERKSSSSCCCCCCCCNKKFMGIFAVTLIFYYLFFKSPVNPEIVKTNAVTTNSTSNGQGYNFNQVIDKARQFWGYFGHIKTAVGIVNVRFGNVTNDTISGGNRFVKEIVNDMKQFWINVGHFKSNVTYLIEKNFDSE